LLRLHIITLFPEALTSYVGVSIVGRAIREKKLKVLFYNPRDYVKAKNKQGYTQVDSKPYGGGPGMVLEALPILLACKRALSLSKGKRRKVIIFSPSGKQFTNPVARVWTKKYDDLILICGRYEGIDARVKKILKAEEISIGPYVLTGGELPALVVLDALARQVEGVLGKQASLEEERVASGEVYTRPEEFIYEKKKYRVPKVLLSGHHAEIEAWRAKRQTK
jgi:tRNA (guanine37-N1)-methyltransferase